MARRANATKEKKKQQNDNKRKERSRDAARFRRSRESQIFTDLAAVLPLPTSVVSHLDKASVMRLIITQLRIMKILNKLKENKEIVKDTCDELFLKAVSGFVLVLALDGDIIFISNNVAAYLKIPQVDLLGQSIYEVTHPCDHSDIKDILSVKNDPTGPSSFFIRMKCPISSKGRIINIKTPAYKVFHMSGRFMELDSSQSDNKFSFVTIASPIPHPSDIDAPLGSYIFLTKHSLDMKFTYADEKMNDFLGYDPQTLIGKSMYMYHHIQDNSNIEKAYKTLFARGQSETGMYRFLAQGGGYIWVSTQATIVYCDKGTKPLNVVCVNYVISEKLCEDELYSLDQLNWVKKNVKKSLINSDSLPPKLIVPVKTDQYPMPPPRPVTKSVFAPRSAELNVVPDVPLITPIIASKPIKASRPQPATNTIFAPKTEDMKQGFLTFTDDESEDLNYLAPKAGDVCVLFDIPSYDVMNGISFSTEDNYSPIINNNATTPLLAYPDDCSSNSLSPVGVDSSSLQPPNIEDTSYEDANMKSIFGLDLSNDGSMNKSQLLSDGEIPSLMPYDWNVSYSPASSSNATCSPEPLKINTKNTWPELQELFQNDDNASSSPSPADYFQQDAKDTGEIESRKRLFPGNEENFKKRKHLFRETTRFVSSDSDIQDFLANHDLIFSELTNSDFENKVS